MTTKLGEDVRVIADVVPDDPVGRQYPGQRHYQVTLPEEETKRIELQRKYDHPDAISLNTYFAVKSIRDPVMQASMGAFTTVRRATIDAWAEIFAKH